MKSGVTQMKFNYPNGIDIDNQLITRKINLHTKS